MTSRVRALATTTVLATIAALAVSAPAEAATAPVVRGGAERSAAGLRASAATGFLERATPCASGSGVTATIASEGFESGVVPYPAFSEGWSVSTADPGLQVRSATTSIPARSEAAYPSINTTFYEPTTAGRSLTGLHLTFLYKTSYADNEATTGAGVSVNDDGVLLNPTSSWTRVYLDVSAQAATFDGIVEVYFDAFSDQSARATTMSVDDVRLYTCGTAANARVRGDWTGEGLVDVLGVTTDGGLYLYPGRGDGRVSSGTQVGSGWAGSSWLGSPGDVTGDGRSDLIQRRAADGSLYLYAGLGNGGFASGRQVGSSWGSFTSLATPGDMTRDGVPDLLGRRSDGSLQVYSFTSSGGLRYVKQVGVRWNGMRSIVGIGDLNGDRRGDVVGVNGGNNCLYAYITTSAASLGSARTVGCGWGAMNVIVSPGDLNRDGLGDLLARRSDGTLWFYPGRAGGGVRSGTQVGSGWNGISNIL